MPQIQVPRVPPSNNFHQVCRLSPFLAPLSAGPTAASWLISLRPPLTPPSPLLAVVGPLTWSSLHGPHRTWDRSTYSQRPCLPLPRVIPPPPPTLLLQPLPPRSPPTLYTPAPSLLPPTHPPQSLATGRSSFFNNSAYKHRPHHLHQEAFLDFPA